VSQVDAPAADWYPDPSERFQFRYWDGEAWSGHVSTDGKTDWDPPGESEPETAGAAEQPADAAAEAEEAPAPAAVETAAPADEQWAPQAAGASQVADAPRGETIEEDEPSDTNLVANRRAGLADDVEEWLNEVAAQVEPRLSRIERSWTSQPQAEAARACAYGLLIGHLAHLHPHMRSDLALVAESHPSFTTLEAGSRLETLEQIAGDPQRTAAWLGPLVGNEDVDQVTQLFD
jgi:hypothetical protein